MAFTNLQTDSVAANACAELRKIEGRARDYETVVRRSIATLRAINGAGMFDHLPADEIHARDHNDAMYLLTLMEDELERVHNNGDGHVSDLAFSLAMQIEGGAANV